jgi:hypothetical protein
MVMRTRSPTLIERLAERRWRWLTAALFLLALAVSFQPAVAQVTIMRYARQRNTPVNYGLPDARTGFTFCRLRYERTRLQRKSGWWDDYPASDFNFLNRFEELTKVTISRWKNGEPGFAQITLQDQDLFHCPFLKMQGGANYDFTPAEIATLRQYFLKGGFLWEDDNWTEGDWEIIRSNLVRIFPSTRSWRSHPGILCYRCSTRCRTFRRSQASNRGAGAAARPTSSGLGRHICTASSETKAA